jgi:ubiquinol-cytochrome c reductase iron-sulfur subunit
MTTAHQHDSCCGHKKVEPCGGHTNVESSCEGKTRRDFIVLTASAFAMVGGASAVWPLIDSLNPAADVLALAATEVDISSIAVGQSITVMWRGKPVFIRRRTQEEIAAAREVNVDDLRDPQKDAERVQQGHEEWLVMVGVCTHLGCVPLGQKGDFGGWFCPCHGSHYDTSGRIRKGPAPKNLLVPEYAFVNDTTLRIG